MSKCLLAASPRFAQAVTPSPSAGTIQSCHAQQEGLLTTSSSSSFLLIHRQKSRRNLVSTILHLLKARGPGNLQLLKLLLSSPQTQPRLKARKPEHSSQSQSKHALSYWKMENKQSEGTAQISPINLGLFSPCWNRSRQISIHAGMCACIDETEPLGSEPSPAVLFLN